MYPFSSISQTSTSILSRFIVCKFTTSGKFTGIKFVSLDNEIYKYLSFSSIFPVFTSVSNGLEIILPYSSSNVFLV
jgi:hypothetical protein